MNILKIDINKYTQEDIDIIVDYFLNEKIVAYPTDTVYGLGGVATSKVVVEKIYDIKKRERKKPLVLIVDSIEMIKKYCNVSNKQARYIQSLGPEPVSVILESKNILPAGISGKYDSLTVRIVKIGQILGRGLPKNDFLIKIISRVNIPLVSTSLNISNSKDECIITGKAEDFFDPGLIDLSVNAGPAKHGKPSRILDIRDINNIKILRK